MHFTVYKRLLCFISGSLLYCPILYCLRQDCVKKEVKGREKTVGSSPAFEIASYVTLRNALTSWIQFPSLWNGQEEEEMRACISSASWCGACVWIMIIPIFLLSYIAITNFQTFMWLSIFPLCFCVVHNLVFFLGANSPVGKWFHYSPLKERIIYSTINCWICPDWLTRLQVK